MVVNPEFKERFVKYLEGVREKVGENMKKYPALRVPEVNAKFGPRYVKVYTSEKAEDGTVHSCSVHSFIDQASGNVLKPDSWRNPAKHARGNIFDTDFGLSRVNHHGPEYLR